MAAHYDQSLLDEIKAEAKTWVGTPFHHQGRVKNVGIDCVGLILGVSKEIGVLDYKVSGYGRIPHGVKIKEIMQEQMIEIPKTERLAGDVGLFTFINFPQHLAIFSDVGMIHAYSQVKKCVEHDFTSPWTERLDSVFRFKGR